MAARIWSSVIALPGTAYCPPCAVRTRFVSIACRTWFRRRTIRESWGTTRLVLPLAVADSAFLTRSNVLGDWGIAARMATWAMVSLDRSLVPKYACAAALMPYAWSP